MKMVQKSEVTATKDPFMWFIGFGISLWEKCGIDGTMGFEELRKQ